MLEPPAAPRDHRDPGRQRPGQRRRHDLLAPAVGGDRRQRRRADPRQLRGPRDLRVAAAARRDQAFDNELDAPVQTQMRIEMRTLVERASRWLVNNRRPPLDSEAVVDFFAVPGAAVMARAARADGRARARRTSSARRDALVGARRARGPGGARWRCCTRRTCCSASSRSPTATSLDPAEVARVHFALGERLGLPGAGRPDPRAAARRPLADDGPGRAARRPVRRPRPADRPGARATTPNERRPGADRAPGRTADGVLRRAGPPTRWRRSAPTRPPTWPGCRSASGWCAGCCRPAEASPRGGRRLAGVRVIRGGCRGARFV